jgi:hypothetical protein
MGTTGLGAVVTRYGRSTCPTEITPLSRFPTPDAPQGAGTGPHPNRQDAQMAAIDAGACVAWWRSVAAARRRWER